LSDIATSNPKRLGNPNWVKGMKSPGHTFKPGNHANPAGRPKQADCLIACIKDELAAKHEGTGLTNEQMIARMLVAQASKGNLKAAEMLMAYTTSKPQASVAISTSPVELIVRWDGNKRDGNRSGPSNTPASPTS